MLEETIDSRTVTGINDPYIAEKADLPEPFQMEAARTTAAATSQEAAKQVMYDQTTAQKRDAQEKNKSLGQQVAEALSGYSEYQAKTQPELSKLSQQHIQNAEEAIREEEAAIEAIKRLPQEEQNQIIEERYKEAKRIQMIAVGIALGRDLEKHGIDPKEWGIDFAAANTIAPSMTNVEPEKKQKIFDAIKVFEARGKVEPADYAQAGEIYDSWVRRLTTDVRNMVVGSNQRRFSAISFGASLNAMADPTKLAAEGVTGGKWYSG